MGRRARGEDAGEEGGCAEAPGGTARRGFQGKTARGAGSPEYPCCRPYRNPPRRRGRGWRREKTTANAVRWARTVRAVWSLPSACVGLCRPRVAHGVNRNAPFSGREGPARGVPSVPLRSERSERSESYLARALRSTWRRVHPISLVAETDSQLTPVCGVGSFANSPRAWVHPNANPFACRYTRSRTLTIVGSCRRHAGLAFLTAAMSSSRCQVWPASSGWPRPPMVPPPTVRCRSSQRSGRRLWRPIEVRPSTSGRLGSRH